MNNLVKLLVVALLAIGVFGGGGFVAYRLFFKKIGLPAWNSNEPVVTPTPDPGIAMFDEANNRLPAAIRATGKKLFWL